MKILLVLLLVFALAFAAVPIKQPKLPLTKPRIGALPPGGGIPPPKLHNRKPQQG